MPQVAILDDYAGVALDLADWSPVQARSEVTVFDRHLSEAEAADALRPFDVVCTMRERMALPRTLIERLPNLKLITIVGMSLPNLDMAAASECPVLVAHSNFASPRLSSVRDATPELAWGLMIATVRNLAEEHRRMRDGAWQATMGRTLSGKTLGLLGLGRIGKRMAEYAKVFGMEVIAWSQNLTAEAAAAAGARRVEKATLFEESDVVSIHLVLSERTRGLVAEPELALMKPHAYLINTSRGPIVDEAALIAALRTGRIAGAGLDVFDVEPPPPDHPLRLLPNVTLSSPPGVRHPRNARCLLRRYHRSRGGLVERDAHSDRQPRSVAAANVKRLRIGQREPDDPSTAAAPGMSTARQPRPRSKPPGQSTPQRCSDQLAMLRSRGLSVADHVLAPPGLILITAS